MNARGLSHPRSNTILLGTAAVAALTVQIASAQASGQAAIVASETVRHAVEPGTASVSDPIPLSTSVELQRQAGASAGLTITPVFDASITGDPNSAQIIATINLAIADFEAQFSDPITVTINFAKGEGLGSSSTYFANVTYASFLAALKADAKGNDDATAVSFLPNVSGNPVNGNVMINVKTANLRAVGISAFPPAGQPDGFITLNTAITNPGSPGSTLTYNLLPVVMHEIDEVLGLGSALPSPPNGTIFPEDLYRYSNVNARSFTTTDSRISHVPTWFSFDAFAHVWAQFDNQNDGGDFGDWQSNPRGAADPHVQDAFAMPGVSPLLDPELKALDVIGYDRAVAAHGDKLGDFDGDGSTEIGVYRRSTGDWWILTSDSGYTSWFTKNWGLSTDIPVTGDFDGDGKTDIAVYRPSSGDWWILTSSSGFTSYFTRSWGLSTDIPVTGDFDGDGKSDMAVYRPSTGDWWILTSGSGYTRFFTRTWGLSTDIPVTGDFDGDGKTDIAIYRPQGAWFILTSSSGYTTYISKQPLGTAGDIPVTGDFDGDGKTDVAIYRPSNGGWWVWLSTGGLLTTYWGLSTDIPMPGDFDGDGKADIAVYRPSTGGWWILTSSSGYTKWFTKNWGSSADSPVPKR
jgi:hypothetical protein